MMLKLFKEYKKYRWFITSSGKPVIGGKSAEQNESLMKEIFKTKKNYITIHTKEPGSPFSVILADIKNISEKDIEETAIFTACFSRAWRDGRRKAKVNIFTIEQICKEKNMKTGTFGVMGKAQEKIVKLKLFLSVQMNRLRCVPESAAAEKILEIQQGRMDKERAAEIIEKMLKEKFKYLEKKFKKTIFTKQEILQALPPGGVKI